MNSGLVAKIKQIFLVTPTQLLGSFVIALAIFLIEFSPIIVQVLEGGSQVKVGVTGETVSKHVLNFLHSVSILPHAGEVITGLVFAAAAIALYLGYIMLNNILISVRNEVVADVNYTRGSVARLMITRFGEKALAAIAFAAFCALSIFILVPFWMDMLQIFVYSGLQLQHITFLIVGFSGLAANIYIVWTAAYFTWIYEESVY